LNKAGRQFYRSPLHPPQLAVEGAVLHRLAEVVAGAGVRPGEIGNGAGHLEDAAGSNVFATPPLRVAGTLNR
jgi:hypothetical protein